MECWPVSKVKFWTESIASSHTGKEETKEGTGRGLISTALLVSKVSLHPLFVSVLIATLYGPGALYSLFTTTPESNSLLPKSQMVFTIVPLVILLIERNVTESL